MDFSLKKLAAVAIATAALYLVSKIVYNVFFHPLRNYPGPFWWRASRLPFCFEQLHGTLSFRILDLHNEYGDVVRVAPNELSFSDARAWKDIHGHRTQGQPEFEKWKRFYRPMPGLETNITSADREEHTVLRRQLAHGFSDRSLREQQPLIMKYVDLFISRLRDQSQNGEASVDLASWYNFTTFDIIGDLVFGEPFGCLSGSDYHPWVKAIFQIGRVGVVMQVASHYPILRDVLLSMVPKKAMRERESHLEFTKAKLYRRLELGHDRPDLIEGLIRKVSDMDKLEANSSILIIGGSETTATLLSGVTFYLLTHPEAMDKLKAEIRSSFRSEEEINFLSVGNLPYLLACLNEALRLYPPVPNGLPRVVPKGGAEVAGHFIPQDAIVAIHQWAMYHNSKHFTKPFEFHPERWLEDSAFSGDNRDVLQPFHIGPRNCLGRNLAYVEMRVIIARLLWNFDLQIEDSSLDWGNQNVYLFWEKGPLKVRLLPIDHNA